MFLSYILIIYDLSIIIFILMLTISSVQLCKKKDITGPYFLFPISHFHIGI